MDVEKRMNLSLDAIIKDKSGKSKSGAGRPAGKKGRGKVRIDKLSAQKPGGRGGTKKPAASMKIKKQSALGVQKRGMKVQKGSRKDTAKPSEPKRRPKGKKAVVVGKAGPSRRVEPSSGTSRRKSGNPARGASSSKRTVDLPKLSDLRITISNDRAAGQPYPMSTMGAPGFQSGLAYPTQGAWGAQPQALQPTYGFGPRNMQPGGGFARAVPELPVPRAQMDYGVSRKALGTEHYVPRRAYKDYDDPAQNKSYMRMDTR